jgi:hypothetical protein
MVKKLRFFCFLCLIYCLPFVVNAQVVTLNDRIIDKRVYVMSFFEKEKHEFYYKVAEFANSYSKKFHGNNICPIYIRVIGYKDYYYVGVDNYGKKYTTELIFSNVIESKIGIYLTLPDTCIELEQLANLLDLGFQNYCMLKECKSFRLEQMIVNPHDYIDERKCELSDLLIKSALNCELSEKKMRFVKRFKIKNKVVCYPSS